MKGVISRCLYVFLCTWWYSWFHNREERKTEQGITEQGITEQGVTEQGVTEQGGLTEQEQGVIEQGVTEQGQGITEQGQGITEQRTEQRIPEQKITDHRITEQRNEIVAVCTFALSICGHVWLCEESGVVLVMLDGLK